MAAVIATASVLPTIKCSNCAREVEMSMMGDHICSISSQTDQVGRSARKDSNANREAQNTSQRDRSFSRPGPPLRVDSSVANRLYLRPNELTPASSETLSPDGGLYGRKPSSHAPQRNPIAPMTQGPPSPEYSNLDCAFPPFPITAPRSTTPVPEPKGPISQSENGYVREHAEPYNQSRPASPSSFRHSRARSVASSRSRNRSGTVGSRPDPITRPSTANGTRKPSPAIISRGRPKATPEEHPPLPSRMFGSNAPSASQSSQPADFMGLQPDSLRSGALSGQAPQRRPLSPNRTQTFPLHNNDRTSGNGPNSFIARRPSEPSPVTPAGRPPPTSQSASERSVQAPGSNFRPYNPSDPSSASQAQADMYPPRTASRNSNRSLSGTRPFPIRRASRTDTRVDLTTLNHPPLPTQNTMSESIITSESHTSTDSASSDTSTTSVAQTSSSRTSSPQASETLARKRSNTKYGNDAAYTPLPDLNLPLKPSLCFTSPESPTDPLCHQGRLSPLPLGASNRSPFSATSASSASSRSSSRNPSSRGLPSRSGTLGGNRGQCRGCSQPITAGQKSISSKDGRLTGRYHKQCFACHDCHGPFETAEFYVHDDHPFCAEHYHALNGSLCSGCGKGIEGQYLEATNKKATEAEKFHPACLTCSSCRISLQNDYYEWMGKVYCERDARRAADVQTRSPNDAFPWPNRPSPSLGMKSSNNASPMGRLGLPSGPRAGLRPPGPGQIPGSGNGFLSPLPENGGARAPPSGGRFPERRTTKLMMM